MVKGGSAMKLGCNYSKQLITLIDEEHLHVDLIKMGDFGPFTQVIDLVASKYPVLVHGFGWHEHLGMPFPEIANDFKHMNQRLAALRAPHLGVHLGIYDLELSKEDVVGRVQHSIEVFKNGLNVPLLMENIDYNPYYEKGTVDQLTATPSFIATMCERYDVNLLLDIAHAKVSADHIGMTLGHYLKELPLHRVKEIHFTGSRHDQKIGYIDTHEEPNKEDYVILEWLLSRTKPDVLTLEYGWPGKEYLHRTKKDVIHHHIQRLQQYCQ